MLMQLLEDRDIRKIECLKITVEQYDNEYIVTVKDTQGNPLRILSFDSYEEVFEYLKLNT